MASLFAKAKKQAPAKTAKKDDKIRIRIQDTDQAVDVFDKIQKLSVLQDNMKRDKAKADMISDELRDLGKEKWAELYEDMGRNPGSVMVESVNDLDDTAQFMFVPTDKYITINEERAEELREAYGDAIVEEKTVFSFDNDMIEKYGEIISRLIEECAEISERDKEKIIKATNSYSVAKGTIDMFTKYGQVADMMEVTRPVVALKNVEVIKG
ncbi:MAG: hypothetical protein ABFD07_03210 [Methanobacterium sp.]